MSWVSTTESTISGGLDHGKRTEKEGSLYGKYQTEWYEYGSKKFNEINHLSIFILYT